MFEARLGPKFFYQVSLGKHDQSIRSMDFLWQCVTVFEIFFSTKVRSSFCPTFR